MAGLMFVVCVPTSEHERNLVEKLQRKNDPSKTSSEVSLNIINNSISTPNLKRDSLITDSIPRLRSDAKPTLCASLSLTSIETSPDGRDYFSNSSETKNGKNDKIKHQEEELSRIIVKKGMTERAKPTQHDNGDLPMETVIRNSYFICFYYIIFCTL
ncbi:hypothetical protein C0J52_24855 [Blattella germanica]|nr:hypothetical protein C0J52_24855 [Blattella germanica]